MLPFLELACFWGGAFFATAGLGECDGAGLAARAGFATGFFAAGFFAGTSFLAGRCGLTTALARVALAGTFFADTGFFAAFAGFLLAAFFGTGFFAAPALAGPAFFLAGLAGLRFDVAIILFPLSLGGRVL
ncbi:hypothetical protein [Rudaea cellulosilytica]|uniref:hypothetical protein n=1 Tax=Rudaea cellulosilytica TaxID=540746 RepID=UPI000A0106AA|nr:hypothetical protein [Rudaea cellulosilytica]